MRILFAEDSAAVAGHVSAVLEAEGHVVRHVADGRSAVEAFRAERPDLVIMDVVMPVLDGLAATREIRALGGERWVPLLIMTSRSTREELLAGFAAGADDYIVKPVDREVLAARIRAMQRIALLQDSLHSILDHVHDGIVTIHGDGRIVSFNRAAESIFGYPAGEVIGSNVKRLMPEPYRSAHDGYLARYQAEGAPRIIGKGRKVTGLRRDGSTFPLHLAVSEVRRPAGPLYIGLVRDISAEEAARAQVEFLARHDPLTGLPNRLALGERLDVLLAEGAGGCVLFIDLDGFKPINDTHGHPAGDQVLVEVARRLRVAVGPEDFVGRLGGDEFVVVLPRERDAAAALCRAYTLIEQISLPLPAALTGSSRQLGASIGVALAPSAGASRSDLLTAADDAMYAAKKLGKGRALLGRVSPRAG